MLERMEVEKRYDSYYTVRNPEGIVVCEQCGERKIIPFGEIRKAEEGRALLCGLLGAFAGFIIGLTAPQPLKMLAAFVGACIGGSAGVKIAEFVNESCRRRPCACYGW